MRCFGFIEILFLSPDANIDPVIDGMREASKLIFISSIFHLFYRE